MSDEHPLREFSQENFQNIFLFLWELNFEKKPTSNISSQLNLVNLPIVFFLYNNLLMTNVLIIQKPAWTYNWEGLTTYPVF